MKKAEQESINQLVADFAVTSKKNISLQKQVKDLKWFIAALSE